MSSRSDGAHTAHEHGGDDERIVACEHLEVTSGSCEEFEGVDRARVPDGIAEQDLGFTRTIHAVTRTATTASLSPVLELLRAPAEPSVSAVAKLAKTQ